LIDGASHRAFRSSRRCSAFVFPGCNRFFHIYWNCKHSSGQTTVQ
jgi:hypothetical protein